MCTLKFKDLWGENIYTLVQSCYTVWNRFNLLGDSCSLSVGFSRTM